MKILVFYWKESLPTTIKNKTKEQKGGFLSKLLGTLGASLSGKLLTGKGTLTAGSGCPLSSSSKNNKGKGILRAGSGRPLSSTSKNKKGKGILRADSEKEWDF